MLAGRRILIGVCGGIAAYKVCELLRMLKREGAQVQAVLTPRAAEFVGPLTFAALSGQPAPVKEFAGSGADLPPDVYAHLSLSRDIDCYVIIPATANTIAKLAGGLADNLVTGAFLSNVAPVIIAPAMNTLMWEHPAVQANLAVLKQRGATVVEPVEGELACGDEGDGRLAALEDILAAVAEAAYSAPPGQVADRPEIVAPVSDELVGRRIIVTAGGTREYLDPVRFITNASTGRLGLEVVGELLRRGASVELAETGIPVPGSVAEKLAHRHRVRTAFDLRKLLSTRFGECDGLVMLAAVADYGPAHYDPAKHKKDGTAWGLELVETPDVLAEVAAGRRSGQVLVGVSLEDREWIERAMKKARAKSVDLMLAVELGADLPFGDSELHSALVTADDVLVQPDRRGKDVVAQLLVDWLVGNLGGAPSTLEA